MRFFFVTAILVTATAMAGIPYVQHRQQSAAPQAAVDPRPGNSDGREVGANGVVEGRSREIALSFELGGRVLAVEVQEGDRVHKGDVLARLDSATWQHELEEAEANLALAESEKDRLLNGNREETRRVCAAEVRVAQVQSQQACKTHERAKTLVRGKLISTQEFEDCEAERLLAEAGLQLAEAKATEVNAGARQDEVRIADAKIALQRARVAHARTRLSKTELCAPCDGIILRLQTEPGELVDTGPRAEPLMTMADLSQLRTRAFVEELDSARILPGMKAFVVADGTPARRFHGVVASCAPYMAPKHHFSNDPGERVDVKVREVVIVLDESQEAMSGLVVGLPVDVYIDPVIAD